jgi:ubiquitin-protein ligase
MKVLITGSSDTPYSYGAYEFDVYFESNYPNMPPKIQLMTTGNNKVRFNPNLYSNGYICLSLLGTWRGDNTETWNSTSNLLQILLSLQAIVMNEDVYFNEPGYEKEK